MHASLWLCCRAELITAPNRNFTDLQIQISWLEQILQAPTGLFRFFPTCEVRVSRFYQRLSELLALLLRPLLPSAASSRSQCALPDLNCKVRSGPGTVEWAEQEAVEWAWTPPNACQRECKTECDIECQKMCQLECQKNCQKIC
jgi:hypothetical protein